MLRTAGAIVHRAMITSISVSGVDDFEGRELIVPGKLLRTLEIFHPTDVHPHAVMCEGEDGQASGQQAKDQVVKSERYAMRNIVEHIRFHAIDAHAHQVRDNRFLPELRDPTIALLNDAEVHLRPSRRGGDSNERAALLMVGYKGSQAEVSQYVAVQDHEGLVQLVAQEA